MAMKQIDSKVLEAAVNALLNGTTPAGYTVQGVLGLVQALQNAEPAGVTSGEARGKTEE